MRALFCDACMCMCACLYCFFKESEGCGLLSHRMSAVALLWSTGRPCIWNTEKIHWGYLLPLISGPVLHWFVCTCVFWVMACVWVSVCVRMCYTAPQCCPLCPWYFKSFWPLFTCVLYFQAAVRWPEWENPCGGQERQEEWGERKARRVIEGFRVILRPRMAVSTCLHNLLQLNI